MGILNFLGVIDKGVDIIDKFVEDKDEKNKLIHDLKQLKEQVYIQELNTKTIPWVDALHKMGRQILSLLSLIIPGVLVYMEPSIDPATIAAIVAPGGLYNYAKGRGQ